MRTSWSRFQHVSLRAPSVLQAVGLFSALVACSTDEGKGPSAGPTPTASPTALQPKASASPTPEISPTAVPSMTPDGATSVTALPAGDDSLMKNLLSFGTKPAPAEGTVSSWDSFCQGLESVKPDAGRVYTFAAAPAATRPFFFCADSEKPFVTTGARWVRAATPATSRPQAAILLHYKSVAAPAAPSRVLWLLITRDTTRTAGGVTFDCSGQIVSNSSLRTSSSFIDSLPVTHDVCGAMQEFGLKISPSEAGRIDALRIEVLGGAVATVPFVSL